WHYNWATAAFRGTLKVLSTDRQPSSSFIKQAGNGDGHGNAGDRTAQRIWLAEAIALRLPATIPMDGSNYAMRPVDVETTGVLVKATDAKLDGLMYHDAVTISPWGSTAWGNELSQANWWLPGPESAAIYRTMVEGRGGSVVRDDSATIPTPRIAQRHAPIAYPDNYVAESGQSLQVTATAGVAANDIDVDGAAMSAALVTPAQYGSVILQADGAFTYVPDAGFVGVDSFRYALSDADATGVAATVVITVQPDAAAGQVVTLAPDAVVTVAAAEPANTGSTTGTYVVRERTNDDTEADRHVSAFAHLDVSSVVSFDPARGDRAEVSVLLQGVLNQSNAGDLYVGQVTGGAWDAAASVPLYAWASLSPSTVGPGSQVRDTVLVADWRSAALGVTHGCDVTAIVDAWINGGAPNYGLAIYVGDVSQGAGFDQLALTITTYSSPANTAPVAVADSYVLDQDTTLTVAAPGLVANDQDDDGDVLLVELVSDVAFGSLSVASDGSFTYTPSAGYVGGDSFSYQVNDGQAVSAPVTVDLSVEAVAGGSQIVLEPTAVVMVGAQDPYNVSGVDGTYVVSERGADTSKFQYHISTFANFDLAALAAFDSAAGDTAVVSVVLQDRKSDSHVATMYVAQVTGGAWDETALPAYGWATASPAPLGPGSQIRSDVLIADVSSAVIGQVYDLDVTMIVDAWVNGGEPNNGLAFYLQDSYQGVGFDAVTLTVSMSEPAPVVPDGLMAWYRFDEGSGTLITDSSGNGFDATLHGGVWTTD
ncbi:MAG: Ig-like domain-containing protein, partial [Planctomycetota bacterium]